MDPLEDWSSVRELSALLVGELLKAQLLLCCFRTKILNLELLSAVILRYESSRRARPHQNFEPVIPKGECEVNRSRTAGEL